MAVLGIPLLLLAALMTALTGVGPGSPGTCTMTAAEELAIFRDAFSLLHFTITSRMGTVLICHSNHLLT
jgi:hypothetical protein